MEQRLYIDGNLMDVDTDTKVLLDIKSNLLNDVTNLECNRTYSIRLPKTAHNLFVLQLPDNPMADSKSPYVLHDCRYLRNGLEIIKDGKAKLLSIGEKIEITIYWGVFPAFQKMQDEDLKLNELDTVAHLRYTRNNQADTFEDAMKRGYFYAIYNSAQIKKSSTDWQGNAIVQSGDKTAFYPLVSGRIRTGTEVGASVTGEIEADSGYKCLLVPFVAGEKATIRSIAGFGSYRSYAILDSNKNVIEIAASKKDEYTIGNDDSFSITTDPLLGDTPRSTTNAIGFTATEAEMTIKTFTFYAPKQIALSSSFTISWGIYNPTTKAMTQLGSQSMKLLRDGSRVSFTVNHYKAKGSYFYVKSTIDGVFYYDVLTSGYDNYAFEITDSGAYYGMSTTLHYKVTYSSDAPSASDYEITAPSNAAYLIVNANTAYSSDSSYRLIIEKVVTETYAKASVQSGSFGGGTFSNVNPYQPSVSFGWILSLLENKGLKIDMEDEAKDYINGLAIPLISRKADGQTFTGRLSARFDSVTSLGVMAMTFDEVVSSIGNLKGSRTKTIAVTSSCTLTFDIQMYYSMDASEMKPQGNRTWTGPNGTEQQENVYTIPANYIQMKVVSKATSSDETEEQRTKTYIIGRTNVSRRAESDDDNNISEFINFYESEKVSGRFIVLLTGHGNIELQEDDTIQFEMMNSKGGKLRDLHCYNGVVTAALVASSDVSYGGMFPIGINLPDIKVSDFLRFISVVTGTFPQQSAEGGNITLVAYDTVWKNKNGAVDWSRKIMADGVLNKPRSTQYAIGSFCQHNRYKWKEDEQTLGDYDADMVVDNKTLDYEQDVVTLPFAASDGNRIPLFGWQTNTASFGSSAIDSLSPTAYSACKERVMTIGKNASGFAFLTFGIDLKAIIGTRYENLRKAIEKPFVVTERFLLSDIDILTFNEAVPVYLMQYGCFFAVTELKVSENGYSEVTMIKLN